MEQKLKLQAYEAIRQRIDMNIVLGRLDRAETGKYVAAHMAYAGAGKEIFTSGAEDEVYKISAGILRMINRVCEKALMYACQQQKWLVDEHIFWNKERLSANMNETDAVTVAYALRALSGYTGKDWL